jgi:hypothetical protein
MTLAIAVVSAARKNYPKHYCSDQSVQTSDGPQERRMHAAGRSKYHKQYGYTNVVDAKSGPRGKPAMLLRRFPGSDAD